MKGLSFSAIAAALFMAGTAQAAWFLNQEQEAFKEFQAGNYGKAAEDFSDHYRRGVALYRAGRYQEAANAFSRAVQQDKTEDAGYNLGNARFQLGDFAGAVAAYEDVLNKDPQHTDAQHNLAIARALLARMEQKQFEKKKEEQEKKQKEQQEKKQKE
ncbi:MAG: tetratricopeptide repeat protein, partial [Chromatiaceae bacterium]